LAQDEETAIPPTGDLARLLTQAMAGETSAVDALLEAYRPFLLRIAKHEVAPRLKRKEAPSDLVQKTLIEAHRDFARFQSADPSEFFDWLRRILLNNIHDARRRYIRSQKRRIDKELPLASDHAQNLIRELSIRNQCSPESDAIRKEDNEWVNDALERLSRRYRQAILWRYRDGLSYEEIAAKIDRSVDAVRMLCRRSLDELKTLLGPPHE
jgi:RNA polymerase sigma-70 factor (ECF subfamily)